MTLATQLAADFVSAMLNTDEFAQSVTYHPSAGGDLVRNALFEAQGAGEELDSRGLRVYVRTGLLTIAADATNGVAAPALDDEVTIDGEKWDVLSWEPHGGVWEIAMRRSTQLDRGASGYRLQR
jgi:hypothetical protein